jgi:hypothetical protein
MSNPSYYHPDAMSFVYCGACVSEAVETPERAKNAYLEIVNAFNRPGVTKWITKTQSELPAGENAKNRILKGIDLEEINGSLPKTLAHRALGIMYPKTWIRSVLSWLFDRDVRHLRSLVFKFIEVEFNNEQERIKGKYKITGKRSPTLFSVIYLGAMSLHLKAAIVKTEGKTGVVLGDIFYDFTKIIDLNPKGRPYRDRNKRYIEAGFKRHSDQKIKQIAFRWYQCRVVHSGIKAFCDTQRLSGKESLIESNVSNEIKECDLAMGYPRGER